MSAPLGDLATRTVDVLIVGAGQAGLAAARVLAERGIDCVVHERHARVGDCWRRRFDSLVLFTPRKLDALPGLPQDGDPQGYPGKDEMGDYLERYAKHFSLPVVAGNGVERLRRRSDHFVATLDDGGSLTSRVAIIATGGFQVPRIPDFAGRLAPQVQRLDAATYRNPRDVRDRNVVIVGDGATGRQIALELVQTHRVMLAVGHRRNFGPQRLLGADTTELALRAGLISADKTSLAGRLVRGLDMTPGLHLRAKALKRAGVEVLARCIAAEGQRLMLADGSNREVDAVIFATGHRDDTSWLDIPGAVSAERFLHDRGVGPVPGLFYVGREWQNSRASGLVCGVARDAGRIGERIEAYLRSGT